MPEKNKPTRATARKKKEPRHGKQANQKLKPYMVLRILWRDTDENHTMSATDLVAALAEMGVYAERRSVYRDIEEINKVALALQEDCTIEEAEAMLADDEDGELKLVRYSESKKGFYVCQLHFDLDDMRLLAECVYSAKFVPEAQAKRLVEVIGTFVSRPQAEKIKHNAFLADRVRTNNKAILQNIAEINDAMSRELNGDRHTPEQISFKYLQYHVGNMDAQIERRHGAKYLVSPYQLLINDGNYYLLAYDSQTKKMRTYRVDRMKDVRRAGLPREGKEVFDAIDLKTYTKRVFSMYGGKQTRVIIRFINPLLDTVVDRFGTKDVLYSKIDERHFTVSAQVEVSDQFFGWLLGFGKRAKIVGPDNIVADFRAYMDKIREMYES